MTGESRGFIKSEAAKALGVRPSLVQFYTDQGIIKPEISDASGKGTRRVYSRRNLLQIEIVKRLVENGVALPEAKGIIESFGFQCKQFRRTAEEMSHQQNFPKKVALQWKEKAEVARNLWEVASWDSAYDLFICLHRKEKQLLKVSVWPLSKDRGGMKINEEISRETISMVVLNITDLMEKVAGL